MAGFDEAPEISSGSHVLFTSVIVLVGSPIFFLAIAGHHWAWIALKVYLWTAIVFGTLLSLKRAELRHSWLWYSLLPLILIHSVIMACLIYVNVTNPTIDDFPVVTYGVILGLLVVEGNWFLKILRRKQSGKI